MYIDPNNQIQNSGFAAKHAQIDGIRTGIMYCLTFLASIQTKVPWRIRLGGAFLQTLAFAVSMELLSPYSIWEAAETGWAADHSLAVTILMVALVAVATLEA